MPWIRGAKRYASNHLKTKRTEVCASTLFARRLERLLRFAVYQIVNDNEIECSAVGDVVNACPKRAGAQGDSNAGNDCVGERDAKERQAGGVGPDRSWKCPQAGAILREQLNGRLVGEVDIAEDDPDAARHGRRRLSRNFKQLIELVAADWCEDLVGAEEGELRGVFRIDLREISGVIAEAGS